MNIYNFITKIYDNYITSRNSSEKVYVEYIMSNGSCKLASLGKFDTVRITLNDLFNVSEKNSRLKFNKILMDYDIKEENLSELTVNGLELFTDAILGAYYKHFGDSKEYNTIIDKLTNKVRKFKYAKKNGLYDRFSNENYFLINGSKREIINEQFGNIEFIILCDLLASYLDEYTNNSSEIGFEKRRSDLYLYKGMQNELALIYINTYKILKEKDSKTYNSKNISFLHYIRKSLFLFTTKSKPYIEFDRENKEKYEESCQSIKSQAYETFNNKLTSDIDGYNKNEEEFLNILKEHNVI